MGESLTAGAELIQVALALFRGKGRSTDETWNTNCLICDKVSRHSLQTPRSIKFLKVSMVCSSPLNSDAEASWANTRFLQAVQKFGSTPSAANGYVMGRWFCPGHGLVRMAG